MLNKPQSVAEKYQQNFELSKIEYALRHLHLNAMPRYMTVVLGNTCNINCRHCYQVKNGDNLFENPRIEAQLRREFMSLYPFLSTLRLQGGEPFYIKGFKELIDDVSTVVKRPIVSVSTNGTLIDDDWAQKIVQMPFQSLTFSIDAGTPRTYAKIRQGSDLGIVIQNIQNIQNRKKSLKSNYPDLDCSFVIMRSNYKEIPDFINLMKHLDIRKITFQTILVDDRNLSRDPRLNHEKLSETDDIRELHRIFCDVFKHQRNYFDRINVSGLNSLFESCRLETSFIDEESCALYPDNESSSINPHVLQGELVNATALTGMSDSSKNDDSVQSAAAGISTGIELCPNPWTLIFVAENGNVAICFNAQPIGNIYAMPLASIWNSPKAIAFRSDIVNARYLSAGCSQQWCSWRENRECTSLTGKQAEVLTSEFKRRVDLALANDYYTNDGEAIPFALTSIRRAFSEKERRIQELQSNLIDLCDKNRHMLEELDQRRMAAEHRLYQIASQTKAVSIFDLAYQYYKSIFAEIHKSKFKSIVYLTLIHGRVFLKGWRVLKSRLAEKAK